MARHLTTIMPRGRITGNSAGRFALLMLAILVLVFLLVFSIGKHAEAGPNAGPPPNQHLRH